MSPILSLKAINYLGWQNILIKLMLIKSNFRMTFLGLLIGSYQFLDAWWFFYGRHATKCHLLHNFLFLNITTYRSCACYVDKIINLKPTFSLTTPLQRLFGLYLPYPLNYKDLDHKVLNTWLRRVWQLTCPIISTLYGI